MPRFSTHKIMLSGLGLVLFLLSSVSLLYQWRWLAIYPATCLSNWPLLWLVGNTLLWMLLIWVTYRLGNTVITRHSEEERLQLVIDAADDGIWDWNIEHDTWFWSARVYQFLGLDPNTTTPSCETLAQCIHPEDRSGFAQAIHNHLQFNHPYKVELRVQQINGSYGWFYIRGKAVRDAKGNPIRMVGSIRDITTRKQAQQERHRFFNLSLDMLAIANTDGYFTHLNPAWQRTLGFSPDQLKTQPLLAFIHPADREVIQAALDNLKAGLCITRMENRYRCADGSYKWLSWTAIPYLEEKLIYAVARDVSERKQAEAALQHANEELENRVAERTAHLIQVNEELVAEIVERYQAELALQKSEALYRTLVETIPHGIEEIDTTGIITFSNSARHRMLGYTLGELLGKSLFDLVPEAEHQRLSDYIAMLVQNQPAPTPYLENNLTQDGKLIDVQIDWNYKRDEQGRITGFISAITDITDRKQAEAIRRALERAQELSELRLRFFSMVSHEFRTPLSTILISVQLLQASAERWPLEKTLRNLRRIEVATKNLTQLLDDILTINRVETEKLECNPKLIDVERFCRQVLDEIQINSVNPRIILFSSQGDCKTLNLDAKLLRSILHNLLTNAIKYSAQERDIQLRLTCASEVVTFQIFDTGIGIPYSDHPHVFEAFYRGTNVGDTPGSGLGLTVVKKCVDLHGGSITFTSEVGIGTTFTVSIPTSRR